MSELISSKEAKLAWASGETVQIQNTIVGEGFYDLTGDNAKLGVFDLDFYKFRLKPRTITLNGVEVEQIHGSSWDRKNPKEVVLEFNNEEAARFFSAKALEIFNNIK